jgi:hypothetical protein
VVTKKEQNFTIYEPKMKKAQQEIQGGETHQNSLSLFQLFQILYSSRRSEFSCKI